MGSAAAACPAGQAALSVGGEESKSPEPELLPNTVPVLAVAGSGSDVPAVRMASENINSE